MVGDGGFSFDVGRSDVTVKMWDADWLDWSFRNLGGTSATKCFRDRLGMSFTCMHDTASLQTAMFQSNHAGVIKS